MKKISIFLAILLAVASLNAQQKEGKVIYQRSMQLQMMMNMGGGPGQDVSQTRTDKFELNFANGQMVLRQQEEDMPEENPGGPGMVVRTVGGGADDVTFCDLEKSRKVESREFFDKKFLITDSIRQGNWKLDEETKTILGHICRKAISQRIGKRMSMSMENGKMERKEMADTSEIVAWFTTDIPVSAGPDVQGQLPGLILCLEANHGKTIYTAIDVSPKADLAAIKEPTKGKKVTAEEFNTERNKMVDELRKNGSGTFKVRM